MCLTSVTITTESAHPSNDNANIHLTPPTQHQQPVIDRVPQFLHRYFLFFQHFRLSFTVQYLVLLWPYQHPGNYIVLESNPKLNPKTHQHLVSIKVQIEEL